MIWKRSPPRSDADVSESTPWCPGTSAPLKLIQSDPVDLRRSADTAVRDLGFTKVPAEIEQDLVTAGRDSVLLNEPPPLDTSVRHSDRYALLELHAVDLGLRNGRREAGECAARRRDLARRVARARHGLRGVRRFATEGVVVALTLLVALVAGALLTPSLDFYVLGPYLTRRLHIGPGLSTIVSFSVAVAVASVVYGLLAAAILLSAGRLSWLAKLIYFIGAEVMFAAAFAFIRGDVGIHGLGFALLEVAVACAATVVLSVFALRYREERERAEAYAISRSELDVAAAEQDRSERECFALEKKRDRLLRALSERETASHRADRLEQYLSALIRSQVRIKAAGLETEALKEAHAAVFGAAPARRNPS